MKKFEAKTLEEAYALASSEYSCSITELRVQVVQKPSIGFFGLFGKKSAIIHASLEQTQKTPAYSNAQASSKRKYKKSSIHIEDVGSKISKSKAQDTHQVEQKQKSKKEQTLSEVPKMESKEEIFENFYEKNSHQEQASKLVIKKETSSIVDEVHEKINALFASTCYDLETIVVDFYDEQTLYVEFSGKDAALLIGKEGYRYKALSYILFNWINEAYGLMLRLEVAEFLKNQEESVYNYLSPVIEIIQETGSYKTKPLDGILVHIALTKLREEFPQKYVAVKTNHRGDKYILVNEYRSNK